MQVTFVVEVPSNILDTRVTGVHAKQTDSTNASAFIAAGNRRRQGQFASCHGFAAIEKDRLETFFVNVASEFLEATLGPLHLLATDCTDALRTDALRNAAALFRTSGTQKGHLVARERVRRVHGHRLQANTGEFTGHCVVKHGLLVTNRCSILPFYIFCEAYIVLTCQEVVVFQE